MPIARINTMCFPGGKHKALTLSYDDGVLQDRRLLALMNRNGVRGTFNLNSGLLGRVESMTLPGQPTVRIDTVTAEEIPTLYAGHEIATHAQKHTALTGFGGAAVAEILADRLCFERLVPYLVRGHAYPFGLCDENVFALLRAAGITYARTVTSTHGFAIPENFLAWDPTCHHSDPALMPLAKQFCEQPALFGQPQLFYLWGHAYEFDGDNNWNVIEEFLDYMGAHADAIWMATNGEVEQYVHAFRQLVYSADGSRVYNPTGQTLWLEALGKVYEIPAGQTVACG